MLSHVITTSGKNHTESVVSSALPMMLESCVVGLKGEACALV